MTAATDPLVARDPELGVLRAWCGQARAARRPEIGLLAGESGVGKSRLVDELVGAVAADGALVLRGTAHGTGFLAFEPWTEALRGFLRRAPAEQVAVAVGGDPKSVAHVPWLADVVGDAVEGVGTPTEAAVAEVVAAVLGRLAAAGPLVVVLDNMQWADAGSVEVLRRLTELGTEAAGYPVLAVERRPAMGSGPWQEALAAGTIVPTVMVELERLDERGCAALLRDIDPDLANPALAAAVYEASGGNPLVVRELADHVLDELITHRRRQGRNGFDFVASVPASAAALGAASLAPLPRESRRGLEGAAVVGVEFDQAVLEAVDDLGGIDAAAVIAGSVEAGLLEPVPDHDGRYRFRHGLVRDSLYTGLTEVRRRRLHRAVARSIETVGLHDDDSPTLAFHYLEAGQSFRVNALQYTTAAARWNLSQGASDTARDISRRALSLLRDLDENSDVDRTRWARSALQLGDVLMSLSDDQSQPLLFQAAAVFEAENDAAGMADCARVLLRLGDAVAFRELGEVVPFVERLLPRLDEVDAARAADVLARFTLVLDFQGQPDRQRELSDRALELARASGDPDMLALALTWHRPSTEPDRIDDWLADARALEALGREYDNVEYLFEGVSWAVNCELEHGDIAAARQALDDVVELEARVPRGQLSSIRNGDLLTNIQLVLIMRRLMIANALGEFREAERYLADLIMAEAAPGGPEGRVAGMVSSHLGLLADHRGQLSGLADAVQTLLDEQPDVVGWRVFAAIVATESDPPDLDRARQFLDPLVARHLDEICPDAALTMVLVLLARVVHTVGDVDAARMVGDRLAGYAGRFSGGLLGVCTGPMDWAIGLCAATRGEYDRAVVCYETALYLCLRMGGAELPGPGRAGVGRGAGRDGRPRRGAASHAEQAQVLAAELQMGRVERLAAALLD